MRDRYIIQATYLADEIPVQQNRSIHIAGKWPLLESAQSGKP